MTKIETQELRSDLDRLLECLRRGERVMLLDNGLPVGVISPPEPDPVTSAEKHVRDMITWREIHGPTLGKGLTIRKLIEEGRKY